jgi:hypothetical protein
MILVCFTCDVEWNRLALVGDFCAATENGSTSGDARLFRLRCRSSNQQPAKRNESIFNYFKKAKIYKLGVSISASEFQPGTREV